ncbi:hypothetical protein DdX_12644 [Ditylenchus destructor]|uniref:Uncharacterized protein n=1 Tax=Ditylenchus destructor TaxID=166010 RepID=A0AAD4MXD0_9BILA|nr:hypothetical protein DdX_12644 [Ditylenchus destructor]
MTSSSALKSVFCYTSSILLLHIGLITCSEITDPINISQINSHPSPIAKWLKLADQDNEQKSEEPKSEHREMNWLKQNSDSNHVTVYKTADVCPYFEGQNLVCNQHLPQSKRCVCGLSRENSSEITDQLEMCQLSNFQLQANEIHDHILTIGISFPIPEQLFDNSDDVFAEDIELFTVIPRESVVIFRKGCNLNRGTFEFQFGLLKETRNGTDKYHPDKLRTLSPEIFTENPLFMGESGLVVEYVEKTHSLRSLNFEKSVKDTVRSFLNPTKIYWAVVGFLVLFAVIIASFFSIRLLIQYRNTNYTTISKHSQDQNKC